jgi:hypothetical protein
LGEVYYKDISFSLNNNRIISLKPSVNKEFSGDLGSELFILKPIALECRGCGSRYSSFDDKTEKHLVKELEKAQNWIINNYVHFLNYKKTNF